MEKIKLLHIINTLQLGGVERIVTTICNALDKNIYNVTLLVLSNNKKDLYSVIDSDVNVIELDCFHHGNSLKDSVSLFFKFRSLKKIINQINPDVINTHVFFYNVIPVLLAVKLYVPKVKHFHTIHTGGLHYAFDHIVFKHRVENYFYKQLSTTLISISEEVKKLISNKYPTVNNVLIENFFDEKLFNSSLKQRNQVAGDEIQLIYVARFDKGKNHKTLISAMRAVVHKHPKVKLNLVGDGILMEDMQNLTKQFCLSENIIFHGYQKDVIKFIATSDVVVFPSEFEGFSISLIECLAVGLPAVCSDIPTFRSLIQEEQDVLYFDVFNAAQLTEKILYVIENKEVYSNMSVASTRIADNYSQKKIISKYNDLYNCNQ